MKIKDDFCNVSPFVKTVLSKYQGKGDGYCLDAPSGSGRNTFFLAKHFCKVLAVDIDQTALKHIEQDAQGLNIQTKQLNLEHLSAFDLKCYDLVCVVHYYTVAFIELLLKKMQKGALLLIESPACHGENFRTLPNEQELKQILGKKELLSYRFRACKHPNNIESRGSAKILIKI
ncbi:class I SAM-dependent methyltransferase [Mucilaginibacter corticis]|nr:class I SAM-dependent methyltransferase [Mucilaginibacter corticis]